MSCAAKYQLRSTVMLWNEIQKDRRIHQPVMVDEVLRLLKPDAGDRAIDLTIGTGGHALAIGRQLSREGMIVGLDVDPTAIHLAKDRLQDTLPCDTRFYNRRFSEAPYILDEMAIDGFDLALADLGAGSHQLDDLDRGFSFDSKSSLDMRYDTSGGPTAHDVVNRMPERELAELFRNLGEERYSRIIAQEICKRRKTQPIASTAELAEIAKSIYAKRGPDKTWRIHPATRVAMALRIYVNEELNELDRLLAAIPDLLAPGGRVAILTWHSLEARRVKNAWSSQDLIEPITDKPVKPSDEEVEANPRARSAQLRAARITEKD